MRTQGKYVVTAIVLGALVTGCAETKTSGAEGAERARSDMNMQEAADRADALLDLTFKAIQPPVQWAHGDTTTGSCDLSRRRVVMTVISEQMRGSFLGVVERAWEKADVRITNVNKNKEFPALYAKTADGFGLRLSIAGEGQAFFEVATPCVEESEVAEPTAEPNGPSYKDVDPIPRPNVRSPFWSADKAP
ncbi:hypothetical protein YW7DRAFT_02232 [Streptomyces sp. AmelKG-E11A]|nr:hypothetical protein YW7DRAFT_02232 [Streptomyces sp. AmelKG-E11A]